MIDDLESLPTFFLNIVGAGNQWLFCSSHGALTAGRESPESALFPYYTVDKIIGNWNTTGPWTGIVFDNKVWNPFRPSIALLSPIKRRLMKSRLGDEVVFEEFHRDAGLRFSYSWRFSPAFGFVRTARLRNEGGGPRAVRLVDGIDNFLPPGIESRMQLHYSCLADAYKISEVVRDGNLVIHRLAAGITDEPIPLESLRATTVWTSGLGEGFTFMDRSHSDAFLRGSSAPPAKQVRAKRGAMLLGRELELAAGEELEWMMVAEINQSQTQVAALHQSLADPRRLLGEVVADIERGSARLAELVTAADGFQQTADRDTSLYHYHNALSNILRGGVPDDGYETTREAFLHHLGIHNRKLVEDHAGLLAGLPERVRRDDLLDRVDRAGDPDLRRLAEEYLPLVLSRRHGDPTRPWNRFFIRVDDDDGRPVHHFEGNWRDIFQNWEALAWSYPDYLDGMISKFLNASTADGFNPYRITSEGVDWETPDPDDPWASIGYWGDHQIIYLLKLLELEDRIQPDRLAARLDEQRHVFVDVPYRVAGWERILDDPRDTIDFDRARHDELVARKAQLGADGYLLTDPQGRTCRATLAEKLLLPALVKLGNLVPDGGIWMNTQRPEWNDANNALAGCGLSVVTACYLHRYLGFLEPLIARHPGESLHLSPATCRLLEDLARVMADERWHGDHRMDASDRFELVRLAGGALERHRSEVYSGGVGQAVPFPCSAIRSLLVDARDALRATLSRNQRPDGLWHSYNVLVIDPEDGRLEVENLSLMLEGQVAVLSSGILEPEEAVDLLQALPDSELRSPRHRTYLLYPDRDPTPFLDSNRVAEEAARAIPTLARMAAENDTRLLVPDVTGGFRFHPDLTNAYALRAGLDALAADPALATMIEADRQAIESLYESTFNHRSFTGRSGTMFGYEGLGCIYWHMVSKLMLAVEETTLAAVDSGADDAVVDQLTSSYFSVQEGLGFRKTAGDYGAFPAEPYSHSPAHAGAKQPGLTGQVKEGILCRLGELGVGFRDGRLTFRPRLLRRAEFAGLAAGPGHPALPEGEIRFTLCRVPVTYRIDAKLRAPSAEVRLRDQAVRSFADARLDRECTLEIIRQTGSVHSIEVTIPFDWLVS